MKHTIKALLFEAYRRNEMADDFELGKPVTERWLGLGTAAAYRPALEEGYMIFFDSRTPPPRCMGWLVLTQKGVTALEELATEFAAKLEDMKGCGYDQSLMAHYMLAGGLTRA